MRNSVTLSRLAAVFVTACLSMAYGLYEVAPGRIYQVRG